MRKMLINAPARGDLDSIDHYLRIEKCNQQAADHFVSEVHTDIVHIIRFSMNYRITRTSFLEADKHVRNTLSSCR